MPHPKTKAELKACIEQRVLAANPTCRVTVTALGRGRAVYINFHGSVWRLLYKASSYKALLKKIEARFKTPEEQALLDAVKEHKESQRVSKRES